MSLAERGADGGARADEWRQRLLAGCELALSQLAAEPECRVFSLRADIVSLRDRLIGELARSAERKEAISGRDIKVRVEAREGGAVAANELEYALESLSGDLNTKTVTAIGAALTNAVSSTNPELALTETQAIALLAQIRRAGAYDPPLQPLARALDQALRA